MSIHAIRVSHSTMRVRQTSCAVNRPASPETSTLGKVGVMAGSTSKRYPPELPCVSGLSVVSEIAGDHESEWAAMGEVARLLGIGAPETVRKCVRQAEVDAGRRPGTTPEESLELKRLRRENAGLKRAYAILKGSIDFFRDRPHHRSCSSSAPTRAAAGLVWGVEPTCTVLSEHGWSMTPNASTPPARSFSTAASVGRRRGHRPRHPSRRHRARPRSRTQFPCWSR